MMSSGQNPTTRIQPRDGAPCQARDVEQKALVRLLRGLKAWEGGHIVSAVGLGDRSFGQDRLRHETERTKFVEALASNT